MNGPVNVKQKGKMQMCDNMDIKSSLREIEGRLKEKYMTKRFQRLTQPDSDYCHDICGSVNGCQRLQDGKRRCRDYDLYERLKLYENMMPELMKFAIECVNWVIEDLEITNEREVLKGNE